MSVVPRTRRPALRRRTFSVRRWLWWHNHHGDVIVRYAATWQTATGPSPTVYACSCGATKRRKPRQ